MRDLISMNEYRVTRRGRHTMLVRLLIFASELYLNHMLCSIRRNIRSKNMNDDVTYSLVTLRCQVHKHCENCKQTNQRIHRDLFIYACLWTYIYFRDVTFENYCPNLDQMNDKYLWVVACPRLWGYFKVLPIIFQKHLRQMIFVAARIFRTSDA